MKNILKFAATALTMMLFVASPASADHREHVVSGQDGYHYLALQVSDNNPGTMNKVLNNALNITKNYQAEGQEIEIRIVAYNAGLHLLREDTSPVFERLKSFNDSMPNVTFLACGNTIKGMTKNEGTPPPIVDYAEVVPGGIRELIDLAEAGWVIIRP
jgi:intracellular sulfur oxidation DsrE/DsrF family protein